MQQLQGPAQPLRAQASEGAAGANTTEPPKLPVGFGLRRVGYFVQVKCSPAIPSKVVGTGAVEAMPKMFQHRKAGCGGSVKTNNSPAAFWMASSFWSGKSRSSRIGARLLSS